MFSEVISQIGVSRRPPNVKLLLFDSVFDPVEPHFHSFGPFLLDGVVDNATAVVLSVVRSVASWWWPISESVVRVTVPSLALTKSAPNSASETDETICLRTVVWHKRGPLERGFMREFVLPPKKKYPPILDLAFGSERYEASLWILSCIPEAYYLIVASG
jgi:hypothetical protein